MEDLILNAGIFFNQKSFEIRLPLIEFDEDGITIIYSPALDLAGYGENPIEAKKSFQETIEEFFKYATNKDTLEAEFKKLGWKLKGPKKSRIYLPPLNSELMPNNEQYLDIVNNKKNYKVIDEKIVVAAI